MMQILETNRSCFLFGLDESRTDVNNYFDMDSEYWWEENENTNKVKILMV